MTMRMRRMGGGGGGGGVIVKVFKGIRIIFIIRIR